MHAGQLLGHIGINFSTVCLSVCLSVCPADNGKKLWTDFDEISWRVGTNQFNFGDDPEFRITVRIQESEVRNPDSLDYRITNEFWWNFTESWGVA